LQQVVSNLLSNGVKFTPPGGHIQVRVERIEPALVLTVQDDGPGIQPDILPYIFDRFRQADSSTTRSHKGLGLGLAIVRHLVEMHGGTVMARNRQDRSGAIFEVRLPLWGGFVPALSAAPAASVEAQPWKPSQSSLKSMRVLVVDDEADAREVLAAVLEACGAHVMATGSAADALEVLQRERPDVLVPDIEMPAEDGYTLIRKVRSLAADRGGQISAVALTAYASSSDRAKALEAGFNRHVPKPVEPRELISVIDLLTRPIAKVDNEAAATDALGSRRDAWRARRDS
jgi:CheY-like chemotaxis protein